MHRYTPPGHKPRKSAFVALAVIVFVVAGGAWTTYQTLTAAPEPAPVKRHHQKRAPSGPATMWQQNYGITFFYGIQQLTVRTVKVTHLDREMATVRYEMTAVPRRGRQVPTSAWLRDLRTYQLLVPGHAAPARKITERRYGNKRRLTVTFRWPRKRLTQGSGLLIQIPVRRDSSANVRLALEVPKSLRGIEERTGDGGL